jgi:hypothetical protein
MKVSAQTAPAIHGIILTKKTPVNTRLIPIIGRQNIDHARNFDEYLNLQQAINTIIDPSTRENAPENKNDAREPYIIVSCVFPKQNVLLFVNVIQVFMLSEHVNDFISLSKLDWISLT